MPEQFSDELEANIKNPRSRRKENQRGTTANGKRSGEAFPETKGGKTTERNSFQEAREGKAFFLRHCQRFSTKHQVYGLLKIDHINTPFKHFGDISQTPKTVRPKMDSTNKDWTLRKRPPSKLTIFPSVCGLRKEGFPTI